MHQSLKLSQIPIWDPFKIDLGTKVEDDFLVVGVRPLQQMLGEHMNLTPIEKFESLRQKDFEMCVLLEDSEGSRVFGLIKFLKFKILELVPEIGKRYRFSGVIEQLIKGYKSTEFAYIGLRILEIQE